MHRWKLTTWLLSFSYAIKYFKHSYPFKQRLWKPLWWRCSLVDFLFWTWQFLWSLGIWFSWRWEFLRSLGICCRHSFVGNMFQGFANLHTTQIMTFKLILVKFKIKYTQKYTHCINGQLPCESALSSTAATRLVVWYSGRTSVFGRQTFPVLRSTCSWWMIIYEGKLSAIGQPTRLT